MQGPSTMGTATQHHKNEYTTQNQNKLQSQSTGVMAPGAYAFICFS